MGYCSAASYEGALFPNYFSAAFLVHVNVISCSPGCSFVVVEWCSFKCYSITIISNWSRACG